MASFTIHKCHLREDRLALDKTSPETLTWGELCSRLAPPPIPISERTLRQLRVDGFIGLLRNKKNQLETFFFRNQDASNKIGWFLKQQPLFAKQLQVVYRVLAVDWGGGVVEKKSSTTLSK